MNTNNLYAYSYKCMFENYFISYLDFHALSSILGNEEIFLKKKFVVVLHRLYYTIIIS